MFGLCSYQKNFEFALRFTDHDEKHFEDPKVSIETSQTISDKDLCNTQRRTLLEMIWISPLFQPLLI